MTDAVDPPNFNRTRAFRTAQHELLAAVTPVILPLLRSSSSQDAKKVEAVAEWVNLNGLEEDNSEEAKEGDGRR